MPTRFRLFAIAITSISLLVGVTPVAIATPPCYVVEGTVVIDFGTCTGAVVIEPGITEIGYFAFFYSTITSIDIPSSVKTIGQAAFLEVNTLTSVTFHEGLISIGDSAFASTGLSSVAIPNSVTFLDKSAFAVNLLLTNVVIGTGITEIRMETFAGTSLTTVNIPPNIKVIGVRAFIDCALLETVNLSEGLEVIEQDAFSETPSLVNFPIPSTVYLINLITFYGYPHIYGSDVLARVAATARARQIRIDAENRDAAKYERARAASKKRSDARDRILAALRAEMIPVINDLIEADFNGVSEVNVSSLQNEIALSRPKTIEAVEFLALKVVLVEKISGKRSSILVISKKDLFAIGIPGMNGPYKSEILRNISLTDSSDRDTYGEIQNLAKKYLNRAEARHDRLIALIERIYARI